MAEGALDAGAVGLGLDEGEQRAREVNGEQRDRRIDRIEQISRGAEGPPGCGGDERDRCGADGGGEQRAGSPDEPGHKSACEDEEGQLGACRERRANEVSARQHLFDGLGVDLDAGYREGKRRRAQIEEAGSARADQDMAAGDVASGRSFRRARDGPI